METFAAAQVYDGYGWTEGGWVTLEQKVAGALVPHCVGWPMPGAHVKVIDPDTGAELPADTPGEVVARSVVPFEGYLNRPDATEAAFAVDGYCRSGDVGVLALDGRLAIVDRVKEMITKLIAFSRERLAHYKCPTEVLAVDALPRNAMGKVTKTDLAGRFTQ